MRWLRSSPCICGTERSAADRHCLQRQSQRVMRSVDRALHEQARPTNFKCNAIIRQGHERDPTHGGSLSSLEKHVSLYSTDIVGCTTSPIPFCFSSRERVKRSLRTSTYMHLRVYILIG
ncbi:uncharacterized protein L969DRAFT_233493 [Mixia osmundae IAM 14324]|uniref:uncharacterized protein n=1 Tax=Mixia osmundae (strain CBS 9802 / IAM 14324 / JCM 22182 / KY 12970) TaxID=764103 RepID=UPI0004A559B0|nr:uncharacterized protein L969DRAFT_233493 [Mixia osmundae IAM 14324]KEI36862.1 hypothetical protein L969DRAFT_233493 [Mixia osmundae IAM 14324]